MSTAVKRACDACHRRKVKCDGINPCRNCHSAQLSCTYNAIPQKKGPKGSRAKVISELRETQRQTSLSAKVQSRMNGIHSPPCSPTLAPTPGLLSSEMVKDCIEFFFANMYPTMPILNRARLEQQAAYMDQSIDTYCLLTSLCAFVMLQPGMSMPGGDPLLDHMPGANIVSATLLMEETIRVRKGYEYLEAPTLNSLRTSYFLFGCYYAVELHEKAWFHLREATTLAYMVGMTKEESYLQYDNTESSLRRRLYWLLFVAERAYALQRGRPVTLQATINAPTPSDDPSDPLAHLLNSFVMLVNLFKPFDETFIALWNKTRAECSQSYLGVLQKQFSEMVQQYMNTDSQITDLRTNQQWLKTMNWHLSMQNGLPQNSEDAKMFQYPIDMSRDLMSMTSQFSTQSAELLGVPLVAKLLDIVCALTDVLASQPSSGDPFSAGPRDHLNFILQLTSVLRGGEHHFLPLLLHKVHDVLPRLANPILQRAPENAMNVDIFDGFGNAGMAQPPMLSDYESKPTYAPTPVPRIEEMPTESGSSNGAQSSNDVNSPFPMVSSPSIMSPGMEYPHMGDFNSMSDMMNPIAQNQQPNINRSTSIPHATAQHQHHPIPMDGMTQSNGMNGQMQNVMHNNMAHGLNQQASMGGMHPQQGLGQNQPFNHMGQGMMNNMMHRPPQPQRANSFAMSSNQIPRTVGDFHALQRANTETVGMGTMAMTPMGGEMDFNTLR